MKKTFPNDFGRARKTDTKLTFKLVEVFGTVAGAKAAADPTRAMRMAVNFMLQIISLLYYFVNEL